MGQCDNCGISGVKTRRLELGGGSGITLCNPCLRKEIAWRKERNKTVWHPFRTKYKLGNYANKVGKTLGKAVRVYGHANYTDKTARKRGHHRVVGYYNATSRRRSTGYPLQHLMYGSLKRYHG